MDRYLISGRDKENKTITLKNIETGCTKIVSESAFSDLYTKTKNALSKVIISARGVLISIKDKIFSDFIHPFDIRRNHTKNASILFTSPGASNDGSFEKYMEKVVDDEMTSLNKYIAYVLIAVANKIQHDADNNNVTNESIATREPLSWNSNDKNDDIWGAMTQVYGDLSDIEKYDNEGNFIGVGAKYDDDDIYKIMYNAALERKKAKSGDDVNVTDGDVDKFVEDLYDILSTNGRLSNTGAAVASIANFITMRMNAEYSKGASGMSGDDPSKFGWRLLSGIPGIGKSAMMSVIKDMAQEGYFSKDGKTPNAYYSSITDDETVYGDLVMITISCENADESVLYLPAREDNFSYRLINPNTNKPYTNAEVDDKMREVYGDNYEKMRNRGFGVMYDSTRDDGWNERNATDYKVGERITSKPACDIPLIKESEWTVELDKKFPPTVVFLDELYMAKPNGLQAIKSLVDKRRLGGYVVPSKVVFIGTTNRPGDFGKEEKRVLSSILKGPTTERSTIINYASSFTEFVEYASRYNESVKRYNVHPIIIEFLKMAENRFRFCNPFDDGFGGDGQRIRSVQRGWTQFSQEFYEIISRYERKLMKANEEDVKNKLITSMLNEIKDVAQKHLLYTDAVAFTDHVSGLYRGVPNDFYEKMWGGKLSNLIDKNNKSYSTDYTYIEKKEKSRVGRDGKRVTNVIDVPHHVHISSQEFAQKAYSTYPFITNGRPSVDDLIPDKDGKIPLVWNLSNAYNVMYNLKFVSGGDKEYMQKLANWFANEYTDVMIELGLPEYAQNNIRIKKAYMFGGILLPAIKKKMDDGQLPEKINSPSDYRVMVEDSGALVRISANKIK